MKYGTCFIFGTAILGFPLHAGTLFQDDFTQPFRDRWEDREGAWTQDGTTLEAGVKFARLVKTGLSLADVEVSAQVEYLYDSTHAASGLQARLGPDGSGYAACLREVEKGVNDQGVPWEKPLLQLYRMDPGGWKLLQECKVMNCRSGQPHAMKLICHGDDLFVFYDDMETPVLREHDEIYRRAGQVALWKDVPGKGRFSQVRIDVSTTPPAAPPLLDWSGVRGAVYVRSDAVNAVQMWEQYWDSTDVVDRELEDAAFYGLNMVQVYLHWIVWDRDGPEYLRKIDDFLAHAEKQGLRVNFVLWDDCGNEEPSLDFLPPVPGRHNSRMMPNPSHRIRDSRAELTAHQARFQSYISGIAGRFKDDRRIAFWQIYNEAMGARELYRTSEGDANIDLLLKWTRDWIKATGTAIPLTATSGGFQGAKYADFPTYHSYCGNANDTLPNADGGPEHLCTETLNRPFSDIPKIVAQIQGKGNGFVIWELMIGRDNCRFPWGHPDGSDEPQAPFHGLVYPDGHPWSLDDVKLLLEPGKLAVLKCFKVQYFAGEAAAPVKVSVTPRIDFNLGDEDGTGSPDASAGIAKDHFAIQWDGNGVATEAGTYVFRLAGDGSADLKIGDKKAVAESGQPVEVRMELKQGQLFPVAVHYRHATGASHLSLSWSGPSFGMQTFRPGAPPP